MGGRADDASSARRLPLSQVVLIDHDGRDEPLRQHFEARIGELVSTPFDRFHQIILGIIDAGLRQDAASHPELVFVAIRWTHEFDMPRIFVIGDA